jgi:hypothetical protein
MANMVYQNNIACPDRAFALDQKLMIYVKEVGLRWDVVRPTVVHRSINWG